MGSPAAKSAYLGWVAAAIAGERGASPTFAAGEHDLILGYATGYDAADVAIFVRSLRAVYGGAVVLVTDQAPALLAFLAEHGVESVPPASVGGAWRPHPVMQRFAAFDALMSARPWARNVLLTDVRDVVFQAPPFDPAPRTSEFYVEYDGGLKGHAFNMKYLRGVGGEDVARALADRPCVCVGTVMGPRECMIRFCRTLLMLAAIPRSEIGGAFGADQAACNIALHLGLVEGEVKANYGRIATIGLTPGEVLSLDGMGRIVNPDGGVSPIVHQYDRHPALMAAMRARWGGGLEVRERRRAKTLSERGRKLKDSLARRLPELR
ncbi:hypothetical protein D8I30_07475 [Brevundimonas naejangsanensis]|uniref:Uncharacterized protein n=1 Tax=Brevundimonas naejangsanensis TaxID=588932 RepID=A0A494RFD0_9CAUL|nr:hypothetical protein [Brevundimonas naejangsanensis]AYG95038.1 hypothetical protein D8I30_07475 [Brevundimonas naejangsanensis]